MSKARTKGTTFESKLVPFLKVLWPRVRRTGSAAVGEADFAHTWPFLIEAKNRKDLRLGDWLRQVELAAKRIKDEGGPTLFPTVIHKRRYYGDHRAYVTQPLESWVASIVWLLGLDDEDRERLLKELLELTPSDPESLRIDPFDGTADEELPASRVRSN